MFTALVIKETDGKVTSSIARVEEESLPEGEVTIDAKYSTLNYKDGMVLNGIGRLVRSYPHIPGVDVSGIVRDSTDSRFSPGDEVVVGGYRFGETRWGGYSELVRVPADWVIKLPIGLTLFQAMAFGTAGFSAMMAIDALESHGLMPSDQEVLVTGAVGGVGSISVALLKALGYKVAASTGRPDEYEYLRQLGAGTIIERSELEAPATRPLESERWSGCIDNVGGSTLGRVLSQLSRGASIASVGLAGGASFSANVMPFLLRGVNILGIDSVSLGIDKRFQIWKRLAGTFPMELLDGMTDEVSLVDLERLGKEILEGKVKGRLVVNLRS
ncbi:MAG: oxidoreductase [Acidimicrobiaceae bacterium]|nr:oxidoreductase [Acidimicrobiaceae bacterium]